MRVEIPLAPGTQHSGSLQLTNESSEKVRARAELLDFMVDETDTVQFQRNIASEAKYSCRQWLTLNPMEVEVAPRSQQVVRYTIRVPQQAGPAGFHCAAGFTTVSTAQQLTSEGIGLKTAVRVVAAMYVVTGRPAIQGSLKEIKVEPVAGATDLWQGVVVLDNPGAMHYRPTGDLVLFDADGKELESQKFNPLPVLPDRQQRFLFPFKTRLENHSYRLRARVDLGGNEIQEGSIVFESPRPRE
jgi:hypothetical protein